MDDPRIVGLSLSPSLSLSLTLLVVSEVDFVFCSVLFYMLLTTPSLLRVNFFWKIAPTGSQAPSPRLHAMRCKSMSQGLFSVITVHPNLKWYWPLSHHCSHTPTLCLG